MSHLTLDSGACFLREESGHDPIALSCGQTLAATPDQDPAGLANGAEPWTDCAGCRTIVAEASLSD